MKLSQFILILLVVIQTQAQLINVNPDKNADPWYVGGLRLPSEEEMKAIPEFVPPAEYVQKSVQDLPVTWDNSENLYFRPVIYQSGGSCAQSSGVGYTFTYEINRLNNTNGSYAANQYPSHYTFNYLNEGDNDNGSFYQEGWDIIKKGGCPTIPVFGGMAPSGRYWMSGYDKYESGMSVRVTDYFSINVGTPEGLEQLKQWLYDHFDGGNTGGIVNFAAGASDTFTMVNGSKIIKWGTNVDHAMTIVGWNDTITYDYNNDGQITNNVDINGDGEVDMKDWERGALIMINTWGSGWGSQGKAYMMYKTLAEPVSNGGIYMNTVHGIHVAANVAPELILRVKLKHNKRNKIKVFAGVTNDLSRTTPDNVWSNSSYFSYQGGEFPMNGSTNTPLEFSLDVSELLEVMNQAETSKFFLVVKESDSQNTGSGQVIDISLVDADGNEYFCPDHNMEIENNSYNFYPFLVSTNATGTHDLQILDVVLRPNPVEDTLHISLSGDKQIETVEIFDATGRKVLIENQNDIDLSGITSGVYYIKVVSSTGEYSTERFLKR